MGRILALVLIADGLTTAVWGRGFLHWQRRLAPRWYRPLLDALLGWPEPVLRLGAAGEALLGGAGLFHLMQKEVHNG